MADEEEVARISRIEAEEGPVAAAAQVAFETLDFIRHFDSWCMYYSPKFTGPGVSETEQLHAANNLACMSECVFDSMEILMSFLARADVWKSLALANEYAVTIGRFPGPSFAEAAFRLAKQRYSAILQFANLSLPVHKLPVAFYKAVTGEEILEAGIDAFIQGCIANEESFDLDLAREQLWKEVYRASGHLPTGLATAEASRSRTEIAYLPGELCQLIGGISTATLNSYAKAAGVDTPRRGRRNFRYPASDAEKILQQIINNGSDQGMVTQARIALEQIESKSKDRK